MLKHVFAFLLFLAPLSSASAQGPLPKNLTPNADIPMAAPDVPMAPQDVPMQGAPETPASSKMININQLPEVQEEVPLAPVAAPDAPVLQPPVTQERKEIKSGRFIEVTELPPAGASGDSAAPNSQHPASPPPDPNAPIDPDQIAHTDFNHVVLFGLNKIAARSEEITGKTGDVLRFKNLEIVAHKCQSIVDNGEKGFAVLMVITELKPGLNPRRVFQGWMFSTTPSLYSLEHPLYDVGVKSCTMGEDKKEAEEERKSPAENDKKDKKAETPKKK